MVSYLSSVAWQHTTCCMWCVTKVLLGNVINNLFLEISTVAKQWPKVELLFISCSN